MSDAHDEHESVIKTPKQLIIAVIAGFLVPIISIVLLAQYVANQPTEGAGSNQSPEAVAARLKPVADEGFTFRDASAPKELLAGDAVYKANCAACHDSGAAGAPKTGDAGSWSARIAKGLDALVTNAIKGIGAMPPKGGNPELDDVEVARAVVFMSNQSGAKFKEPEVKQAAPAAATSAAAPASNEPQGGVQPQGAAVASATNPLASPTQAAQGQIGTSPTQTAEVGKKLYEASCAACHSTGAAGAPKLGDKAAWEPRIKQGKDTLYANAIKGFQGKTGFMPPKGGAASASDADVKAAVDYMVSAAK